MKNIYQLRKEMKMKDSEIENLRPVSSYIEMKEKIRNIISEYEKEFNHLYLINNANDETDDLLYDEYIERLIDSIIDNEISFSEIF